MVSILLEPSSVKGVEAREPVGEDYPIMIKMNCDDFMDGGLTGDEAVETAKIIVEAGIDCIEVTGGTGSDTSLRMVVPGINKEEKEAYFAPYAKLLKEHVSVPIILVGACARRVSSRMS